jgi:hypothetical protein
MIRPGLFSDVLHLKIIIRKNDRRAQIKEEGSSTIVEGELHTITVPWANLKGYTADATVTAENRTACLHKTQ